ncbi:MAG TPA: O-antigen ligase family protein [Candidatus Saccharimonadia bacterium]
MMKLKRLEHILLCGILVTLPLERLPSVDIAGSTVRISQVLGLLLIAVVLPKLWRNKRDWLKPPWLFLALFNLAAFASAALSSRPDHSIKVAGFILFVSLLGHTISQVVDRSRLKQYLTWAGIGVVGSCLFGLYQFIGDLAGLPYWLTGLREEYAKGGIFAFPRIQSTALEPLYFSNYLLVPLAVAATYQAFRKARKTWPISFLILIVITLGLSRGAQAASACIILVVVGVAVWKGRLRPALGVLATTVAAVGVGLMLIGFASILYEGGAGKRNTASGNVKSFAKQASNINQGESAQGRALTRHLAVRAAMGYPWLGLGPGNFGVYAMEKRPDKFGSADTIVNNEVLEVAAENGLMGLVSLLLFVGFAARAAVRAALSEKDSSIAVLIWALLLGLGGIVLQYQLFSTLYITHIWVAIGLLLGLSRPSRLRR